MTILRFVHGTDDHIIDHNNKVLKHALTLYEETLKQCDINDKRQAKFAQNEKDFDEQCQAAMKLIEEQHQKAKAHSCKLIRDAKDEAAITRSLADQHKRTQRDIDNTIAAEIKQRTTDALQRITDDEQRLKLRIEEYRLALELCTKQQDADKLALINVKSRLKSVHETLTTLRNNQQAITARVDNVTNILFGGIN